MIEQLGETSIESGRHLPLLQYPENILYLFYDTLRVLSIAGKGSIWTDYLNSVWNNPNHTQRIRDKITDVYQQTSCRNNLLSKDFYKESQAVTILHILEQNMLVECSMHKLPLVG